LIQIPLTQGKFAIVDIEDYEWLSEHKWFAKKTKSASEPNGQYYAARSQRTKKSNAVKTIYMHREIMNCPDGKEVDHANNNKLDNRRENLRVCTKQENIAYQHHKKVKT